ncbi:MAG: DUF1501 domain-containing protein [Planctomycetaceae bacterium]|nr:DUF1501 domain-containing protein [Planctomycetaceae bacterium]
MRPAYSRRRLLQTAAIGFGGIALAGLQSKIAAGDTPAPRLNHPPRAKRVIFCFMSGGVSHVDSFDPKPRLTKDHGKPMPVEIERTQFNNNGSIMGSPFEFTRHGQSGLEISSMFPHLGNVADELAVIRSMTTPVNEHAQGNFLMHSGFPFMGHPSAGAWTCYGLGIENENLPGYVVLQSGGAVPPHGGVSLFSNGFLPAIHQGSILQADKPEAIANISPQETRLLQRRRLNFIRQHDQQFLTRADDDAQVEAAIRNYETAYRMQSAVPELCDISGETPHTLRAYGIDSNDREMAAYGRQCLLARRLAEKGVRFIELSCLTRSIGAGGAANPWDQHGDLERGHRAMAGQIDQPITAMIRDLRERGLLDETLIIWAGEFGRTPFSQGSNGRDHNPFGFSVWMAGGGVKGGSVYGATDEFGYHVVENKCTIYDMWATVLHQLGINHERLTYRYGGRDFRLTDVYGNVLSEVLA